MFVCKEVSAIMCHLRAEPVPCCQERGDIKVRMWFHGSVAILMSIIWVIGRGVVSYRIVSCRVVSCRVVLLMD